MPIPNLPGRSDFKQQCSIVSKAVKLQMHAMGVAAQNIPAIVVRTMSRAIEAGSASAPTWDVLPTNTDAQRKRVEFAKATYATMEWLIQHSLCKLNRDFVEKTLYGLLYDDAATTIGYHVKDRRYTPVAVVSWATADHKETIGQEGTLRDGDVQVLYGSQDNNAELNKLVKDGSVADITLVCSAQPPEAAPRGRGRGRQVRVSQTSGRFHVVRGSATALLMHVLSALATRKRQGQRRYKAIIVHAARNQAGRLPIQPTLERMGFEPCQVWFKYEDNGSVVDSGRAYYVLREQNTGKTWVEKFAEAITWNAEEGVMERMCPLRAGTGRASCT